jgi:arylsulfatase A-like enzyme
MRIAGVWIAGLAIAVSVSCAQTVAGAAPDVYLITIDTLRADHVHCYGDDQIQTPALDSIAQDGIRFTQAFTPSPITNTAHTSILTGLLPSVHGVTDFGIPLAKTIPTWAELLKQNGYQTAAFIGAVVLDSRTLAPGLDRGFDYYDNFPSGSSESEHWGRVERRGEDVVHRAEAWMDGHPTRPRFVWVHLYDPHDPYEPPPPFAQIYKDRLYDGEIAYADSALGHLLTYLKRQNRYNHALIVVVGDHGEGLGEHGEQTHGIFLYDATTHVPLLIKLPVSEPPQTAASRTPAVVEAQVQTTDILPTILDLLDIAAPVTLAKRSLRSYFSEAKENDRVVFGETDYPLRFGWAPLRAVRSGGFKFIEAPRPEFYDVGKDPGELKNEYEPWNPTVQRVAKRSTSFAPWDTWGLQTPKPRPTFLNYPRCLTLRTKSRSRTCFIRPCCRQTRAILRTRVYCWRKCCSWILIRPPHCANWESWNSKQANMDRRPSILIPYERRIPTMHQRRSTRGRRWTS